MLASRPLELAGVAKVYNRKAFDRTQFEILTLNKMLQILPVALPCTNKCSLYI